LTVLTEFDRGTEGGEMLRRKLAQYDWLQGTFRFDAVLVVADSEKLEAKLCRTLKALHRFKIAVCELQRLLDEGVDARLFSLPLSPDKVLLFELVDLSGAE